MSRFRCLTCLGEYEDVLPDGNLYFHACPPATKKQVKLLDQTITTLPLATALPVGATLLGLVAEERANNPDGTAAGILTPGAGQLKIG